MKAVRETLLMWLSWEEMKRAGVGKRCRKGRDRVRAVSDRNEKHSGVMGEREEQSIRGR